MEQESTQHLLPASVTSLEPNQSPLPSSAVSVSSSATTHPSNHLAKEVKVWLPSANAQPAPRPVLGDDYFVPTAAEAQRAFSSQVASREKLTDAPMLTKNLREREQNQKKNEKLARFPITRIRIKFGDRSMLEGSFPSTSKISDVYQFVKESLQDDVRTKPFILYQTPPRREFLLKDAKIRSSNLLDLQLAPSSLLLIKFTDEIYNHSSNRPPLMQELLDSAQPLPSPPTFEPESSAKQTDNTLEKGKQKVDDILKSGAKVPKWLQNLSSLSSLLYFADEPPSCFMKDFVIPFDSD
ncbi:hypothetical protein PCASD_04685 [Puccinia coronata f. sp. avenae]|uniref:UBX domain-containing protein n=1 Tax=Puccinia coronata f. sp. avenae TaxID=200324 RepID=A0A2N5UYY0_9BASI|nr:hypothetical protein PCASD_04685 [Puccinia coronata f. sp. avenae]